MLPDFGFDDGLRSAAIFGAPIADGSVFGLDGVHPCLIGRPGCNFGGAVRIVFIDWPDGFMTRSYVAGRDKSDVSRETKNFGQKQKMARATEARLAQCEDQRGFRSIDFSLPPSVSGFWRLIPPGVDLSRAVGAGYCFNGVKDLVSNARENPFGIAGMYRGERHADHRSRPFVVAPNHDAADLRIHRSI
jgi:hypothetical protein